MSEENTHHRTLTEMISRRRLLGAALAGGAGLALGAACKTDEDSVPEPTATPDFSTSGPPNIVMVFTDEHRPDALQASGNPAIETPNLDQLAAEGTRFTRTYVQGPLCQPSRASLITGRYLHEHGHIWNRMTMKQEWPTMMKQLQKAGYTTAKFGKFHFYDGSPSLSPDMRKNADWLSEFGFDYVHEEFDKYVHVFKGVTTHYMEYLKEKGLLSDYLTEVNSVGLRSPNFWQGKASVLPQEEHEISYVADRAIDWLRSQDGEKPFFLWVSIIQPHAPLIDDQEWAKVYKDASIPLGPTDPPKYTPGDPWGRYMQAWLRSVGTQRFSEDYLMEMARHYYGMVSLIDQKVGDIRKAVEEQGWGDNTWFIFTADHGEMLGDHGLMAKNVFYKSSVLVPNIIRPPRGMKPRVADGLTQQIDVTATILDVAGAEPPEGAHGQSLLPVMSGESAGREVAFSELGGHQGKDNFFAAVWNGRYRYTYDRNNEFPCELFDLQEDPDELNNLVEDPAHKGIREDLHKDYVEPFLAGELA